MNNSIELLTSLLGDAKGLKYQDGNLDRIEKRADMLVKKVFGVDTEYIIKLNSIHYTPSISFGGMDDGLYRSSFESGKQELINLINVMLEDLALSIPSESSMPDGSDQSGLISSSIFLVHGHNEEIKQTVARFIEKIGLMPIILHEQPNRGRTIIEKFTDYSNVSFAVILLSADDVAFKKTDDVKDGKFRARQNVILELGYFLGKIGRDNVVVLHEQSDNLEIPSDYAGVLYVPFDSNGNWRLALAKELRAAGYTIDGNKLLD